MQMEKRACVRVYMCMWVVWVYMCVREAAAHVDDNVVIACGRSGSGATTACGDTAVRRDATDTRWMQRMKCHASRLVVTVLS